MCGRYFTRLQKQEIATRFRAERTFPEPYPANYNIAPTAEAPVIRRDRDTGELELAKMIWSQQKYVAEYATFNAKGERLLESNLWKSLLKAQRVLLPMSGFYEFPEAVDAPTAESTAPSLFGDIPSGKRERQRKPVKKKRAIAFGVKDTDMFLAGGLWSRVRTPDGPMLEWFTVITTDPNELLAGYHDRMPWILTAADRELWLDTDIGQRDGDLERLASLVSPFDADKMTATEANPAVGNVRNNGPEMLEVNSK